MSGWFGVRCLFDAGPGDDGARRYEERVTVWAAESLDEAIERAEQEAATYAADIDGTYLALAQAYAMVEPPAHGVEVFSLMRDSELPPSDYLDHYFDSGRERQQNAGD
jgi:hypothetical protein